MLPRIGGGRVAALEILVPTPAVRNLVREDKVHQIYSAMQTGQEKAGMQTANGSLARLYAGRQISLETAMNASSRRDELQEMLGRKVGGGAARVIESKARGTRPRASVGDGTWQPLCIPGRMRSGERISGECGAESIQEAVAGLRREQIVVTRIEPANAARRKAAARWRRHRAVKPRSLAAFTRQFAVMIDAGLPLVTCLDLLGTGESDRGLAHAILQTRADVERGSSLADAMKKHPAVFDPLYANMIAAGETGGILDTILERLAIYIEKAVKLRGQVASAMIYPAAVITIAAIVVGVILWKVIPTFAVLFTGLGAELPLPTRIVVALSDGSRGVDPLARRRGGRGRVRVPPLRGHAERPARDRRRSSRDAGARSAPAEDCGRAVLPHARHAHRFGRARSWTVSTSPRRRAATP